MWVVSEVQCVGGESQAVNVLYVIQSLSQKVQASVDTVPDGCFGWVLRARVSVV